MQDKLVWKKEYTLVLVLNIVYILLFQYLMSSFT